MKKLFLFFTTLVLTCSTAFANDNIMLINAQTDYNYSKDIKEQMQKIKTKRIIIANALLLSDSQKEKANNIYSNIFEKETLLIVQLKQEKEILKNLNEQKDKKYSLERKQQRKVIAELEDAIKKIEKDADKDFSKILCREQRSKFKRLNREIQIKDF